MADWNRELANNPVCKKKVSVNFTTVKSDSFQVILPVDLRNWVVFYTQQDTRYAREFSQHMVRLAGVMGCIITQPRMEVLPNDHTATYVNYVKSKIDSKVQVRISFNDFTAATSVKTLGGSFYLPVDAQRSLCSDKKVVQRADSCRVASNQRQDAFEAGQGALDYS